MTDNPSEPHGRDDPRYAVRKSEAQWRAELDPAQYRVAREAATERAFSGAWWNHTADGHYLCVGCGAALFDSSAKFDAGCGWPSYRQPVETDVVEHLRATADGLMRVQVRCSRCGSHLGHLYDDGPEPAGHRYCINSASIEFRPVDVAWSQPGGRGPAQ